eukprot:CAMPEP_0202761800 /NCGR_PEP_ID=MMETSP1388-20130828/20513_1 /ASSEMBLY_ACC=CAM_ASM_000864 /TAXON_ID=37098 /ORGANISM="Isochrysis sp, Strain CCMP1244" /LENGTH=114 /DNA_ID=CAMNT_0049429969 /DNA_START=21 /DNA_END=361 /DNA_ORIENTATION=-
MNDHLAALRELEALADTQRALLQKIENLEEQEALEQGRDDAARGSPPSPSPEDDTVGLMIQKQRELQQMRQSIAELKQLQLSVQQLLVAEPPAPAGGLASRPHTDPAPPAAAPP